MNTRIPPQSLLWSHPSAVATLPTAFPVLSVAIFGISHVEHIQEEGNAGLGGFTYPPNPTLPSLFPTCESQDDAFS